MFFFYTLLYSLGLLLFFPREFLKRPSGKRLVWLKEKLGLINPPSFSREVPILWIHAVSVGEVLSLTPLLKVLSQSYNLVITTITDTGKFVAERRFAGLPVKVYYLPFDLPCPLRRFYKRIRPKALLITETELWPNLIKIISGHIPIALINGRISEGSFKNYFRFRFFFRPLLENMTFLAVQEEVYAERLKALGLNPEKIQVVGNLKFELSPEIKDFVDLETLPRPLIIAGSTHPPEEELILRAFFEAASEGTLVLVPRHPERFPEVEKIIMNHLPGSDFFAKYSTLKGGTLKRLSPRGVILFDEMGALASLYRICDLAILGGSFLPRGGQNPLEAIYWKKAVIMGPYTDNFPFVKEFTEKRGLIQIDPGELVQTLRELLEFPEKRHNLGERAYALLQQKRGALSRTVKLIEERLL